MQRLSLAALAGLAVLGGAPAAADLPQFVGALHTHTGYSDGVPGTRPADAYERARDVEGLGFIAVTEHSETLQAPSTFSEACLPTKGGTLVECAVADPKEPRNSLNKWDAQRRQATAESRPESFLALRGFEWSSEVFGHMNVYFSRNFSSWLEDGGAATTAGFYTWLQTPPWAGGGADGLATFNHPNAKKLADADPRKNWNDFAYVPELDGRIVGIEVFNQAKNFEPWVIRALDKGWHLGVIGAEDIHKSDWGSPEFPKTVFLAPSLTPIDLKEAMGERHFYATLDRAIRIDESAAGEPMGARIRTQGPTVNISVSVTGGDVVRVDLLTAGGAVAATAAGRDLSFTAPAMTTETYYLARVVDSSGRAVAYSSPVWVQAGEPAPAFAPRWMAGDLHVHTTYSHDSYGGPDDDNTGPDQANTLGWSPGEQIGIAESRGLDFVVITDHNDTRSLYDPGFTSDRLILVPGYENSLAGHAQMIGAISCYFPEGRQTTVQNCNQFPDQTAARIRTLRDALRADGGAFQINHPYDGHWLGTFGDGASPDPIVPDSVEVWNIGPWHYQPPFPAASDNDFSLRFWETFLDAGFHVGATGGSDNHWRSTTAVQGVGQPTTWVYVTKPGIEGVIEGIRAGRTTISHEPPGLRGPQLFLEANADSDGIFESMVGDSVSAGATMRIRGKRILPGSVYRIVTDRGSSEVAADASEPFVTTVPEAKWLRVELRHPDLQSERSEACDPLIGTKTTYCRNRIVVEALTSAIYVTAN